MQAQQILTYILYGLGALIASAILALLYKFVAIGVLNLPTYFAALLLIIRKGLEMVSDQIGRLRRFSSNSSRTRISKGSARATSLAR